MTSFDDFLHMLDVYHRPLSILWYIFGLSAFACLGAGIASAIYDAKSPYIFGLLIYGSLASICVVVVYFVEILIYCLEPKPLLPLTSP